ncbi:MAG TPA: methylenetetrahydrofolate reductase [Burkholderiales bacterium]
MKPGLAADAASSTAARPAAAPDLRTALIALVRGFSIETTVRTPGAAADCARWLAPGTRVYISMLPGQTYQQSAALTVQLARAGLAPVPHITARGLVNARTMEDFIARVHGEAGVDKVLLLGGDRALPAGPFASAADLLATGMLARHGVREIEVAGYPEGHPDIDAAQLDAALEHKITLAREQGLRLAVMTQFCFRPERIAAWTRQAQAAHPDLAVAVGLAGPAGITTLLKYAARCGVAASLGMLGKQSGSVLRLISEAGPEPVVQVLAAQAVVAQAANITPARYARCHLFSFGGIERTARWARAVEEGRFELTGADHHLSVGAA